MESIKDPELGRERGMGKNIKSMQVLWFVNTATISYPRRPNYYFDIHEEVDHLYYYHLHYDRRMGINTFQPDDFERSWTQARGFWIQIIHRDKWWKGMYAPGIGFEVFPSFFPQFQWSILCILSPAETIFISI